MRVFVAGAAGALGSALVPLLVEAGHEVVGTTRSRARADEVRALGAEPAVMDGLDAESVRAAVAGASPDAIVHQLTSLTGMGSNMRKFDRDFAVTNRLRTEGTDNLIAAGQAAGVRRIVAQSFAGWPYAREGGPVKTEDDPLDPDPPAAQHQTLDAMRRLERALAVADGIDGIALRYGGFYGPRTTLAEGGIHLDAIRKGRFPIVGSGAGVWSFIQIEDAAAATLAALERGQSGVYNVVDDEPAPVSEWLPYLAEAIGAKPPRRVPEWLGRVVAGEVAVSMMTRVRGASNAKAKRELAWQPRYASWREGFRTGLGRAEPARA